MDLSIFLGIYMDLILVMKMVMYPESSRCSLSIKVKVLEGLNLDIPASALESRWVSWDVFGGW
jgi:hypothetical protein